MYFSKENSYYQKTPYTRPIAQKPDPTVCKILNKPRTSENNYGRSLKPLNLNEEPSTSYENIYNYPEGVYGITITSCYTENIKTRPDYETVHFKPRKSQLGSRIMENTYDNSVDMKMMTIAEPEVSGNLKNSNFKAEVKNIQSRQNLLRIFTGSVENVLHWAKLKNSFQFLFEVTANIDYVHPGKWKTEKLFCLSDSAKSGFKLQVVYHEIDRPLPRLPPNSLVTCIGRLLTRNRLQAYKIDECDEEKKNDLKRLSFICNRVADEIVAAGKKNE